MGSDPDQSIRTVPAHCYQQFHADPSLDVPAEGFGGWRRAEIEISLQHTALAVMHAWDTGAPEQFPGWHRCVEYLPRANRILAEVFPPLLEAVRQSPMRIFHIAGGGGYYRNYPGYEIARRQAGQAAPAREQVAPDPTLDRLKAFRQARCFVGEENREDVAKGFQAIDFPPEARPLDNEPIASTTREVFALCKNAGVNHLVYAGFAVNWCLLMSPGGMVDMSRHGVMCSVLRQAVTAVENKETARSELGKELALWRVAVGFGFVFDVAPFAAALSSRP